MKFNKIINDYLDFLGPNPTLYFSPGRVNLIGEHIDYNNGHVFPTAIDLGIYGAVTPREDMEFHFYSVNYKEYGITSLTIDELDYNPSRGWVNYPVGVIKYFVQKGLEIRHGLNILIYGTLPSGAGLSSSASLEMLMGVILQDTFAFVIDRIQLVQLCQQVENEYIGVNCGIMDQFAVGMNRKNHAIYLNTNTLEYELVPFELQEYELVIVHTGKKRALVDSEYNLRREECALGLTILQEQYPHITGLCDINLGEFMKVQHLFTSLNVMKRVRHAVSENERTKDAKRALYEKDFITFGKLLTESHNSLQNDYEVSCKELDTLVHLFMEHGALGARMTGAGFGGCIIALINQSDRLEIESKVVREYTKITGLKPTFYRTATSDGTKRIVEEEKI